MRGLGHEPGRWRTSSYSGGGNGDCVEAVLGAPRTVGLRDSAHPAHAELVLPAHQWVALLRLAGHR
ncbi:DUF397 domain-containing protein [Nocardiopsis synnemataformans]|uniref:DUF397 domain-containing protein n=1 Tax=Nocardiopsis synnemataformans TaxID=61305 RepID=UPI003EBC80EC